MSKSEFYKDRILWRVNKHKLFKKRCLEYSELSQMQIRRIQAFELQGIPILAFWKHENQWTILTSVEVLSFYDGMVFRINLDEIEKHIEIQVDETAEKPKFSTEFIYLGQDKIKIWVFAGEELFALYNTLRMFPLNYTGYPVGVNKCVASTL